MPGKSSSVTDHVYASIKDGILQCRYFPGEHLVEADLSAEYGCSRASLRVALRRLADEGLTEYIPNRGVRVKKLNKKELADIHVTLRALEMLAAQLAAQNRTDEDMRLLREQRQHLIAANEKHDRLEAAKYTIGFQLIISEASGNSYLSKLIKKHYDLLQSNISGIVYRWNASGASEWQSTIQFQSKILDALEKQDSSLTGDLVFHHFEQGLNALLQDPRLFP